MEDYPRVTFACDFDERTAFDVEEKGYFDHAFVTLEDGSRYRLHFYDPARLSYELSAEQKNGGVCVAEPGLIVIPKVTRQLMMQAVKQLAKEGYFQTLRPMCEETVERRKLRA